MNGSFPPARVMMGLILIAALVCFSVPLSPASASAGPLVVNPVFSSTEVIPPAVQPVIYMSGSPYEMGLQYGRQAGELIRTVQAFQFHRWDEAKRAKCRAKIPEYERHLKKWAPYIIDILKGMARGAGVSYEEIFMTNAYYDLQYGPAAVKKGQKAKCSNLSVRGGATKDGKVIIGQSADTGWSWWSYTVVLVAFPSPESGLNSFITVGTAGLLGNVFYLNDKGLANGHATGEAARKADVGFGIPTMLIQPIIAMSCSTVDQARELVLTSPRSMGQQYHLADKSGAACVIEGTHALAHVRRQGDFGEKDYLISTNHWLSEEMKPAKYPKPFATSPERYATIERLIKDNWGKLDVQAVMDILATDDWFDGRRWHRNQWGGLSMGPDRVIYGKSTEWAGVALPEDGEFYACAGDAGGINPPAPGQSGAFIRLVLKKDPRAVNDQVKQAATRAIYHATGAVDMAQGLSITDRRTLGLMIDKARTEWWLGYNLERQAIALTIDGRAELALPLFGRASTAYSRTQAVSHQVRQLINLFAASRESSTAKKVD